MKSNKLAKPFDVNSFNDLMTVEEADRIVRDGGENSLMRHFLGESASLFIRHGMESRFGVALLHKHYACAPEEVILETEEVMEGVAAIVTRPRAHADAATASPTVWRTKDGRYQALAFSRDPTARRLYTQAAVEDEFLDEFAELARRHGVEDLFGLAVVERGLYARAGEGETPLEVTDMDARANVVTLRDRKEVAGSTIETSWSFRKVEGPNAETECASTCKTECWNIHPDGHEVKHYPHHIQRPD